MYFSFTLDQPAFSTCFILNPCVKHCLCLAADSLLSVSLFCLLVPHSQASVREPIDPSYPKRPNWADGEIGLEKKVFFKRYLIQKEKKKKGRVRFVSSKVGQKRDGKIRRGEAKRIVSTSQVCAQKRKRKKGMTRNGWGRNMWIKRQRK